MIGKELDGASHREPGEAELIEPELPSFDEDCARCEVRRNVVGAIRLESDSA